MDSTGTTKWRSRVGRGLAVLVTVPAVAIGLSALPAGAAVTGLGVSPGTGLQHNDTVTVSFRVNGASTFAAIAECRDGTFSPLTIGLDCDDTNDQFLPLSLSTPGVTFDAGTNEWVVSRNFQVHSSFTDVSFVPGLDPVADTTTCTAAWVGEEGPPEDAADCVIAVSEYTGSGMTLTNIDLDKFVIEFDSL